MALTSFQDTYTIQHAVSNPDVVAIDQNDSIEIVLVPHPVTGTMIFDSFVVTPGTSPHTTVWSNATNVAYDPVRDQITGSIWTLGPPNGTGTRGYCERVFCMSLDGDPTLRAQRLHCYVGIGGTGGDPDDGSWAGDVN
jgi:hypothetical protein